MSTYSSSAIHAPNSAAAAPQALTETDSSFDARWMAWLERGRQRNLAVKRRLRIGLLCAAALGAVIAIFFGIAGGAR